MAATTSRRGRAREPNAYKNEAIGLGDTFLSSCHFKLLLKPKAKPT